MVHLVIQRYRLSRFVVHLTLAVAFLLIPPLKGMVYTSLNTPYMKLFEKFLAKKHKLAVDAWGTDDAYVKVWCWIHLTDLVI